MTSATSTPPGGRAFHGIDVGGSKIELVSFVDNNGNLIEQHRRRATTPAADFAAFQRTISMLVEEADGMLRRQAPVGMGLPGLRDPHSGRIATSNLPALNGHCIAQELGQHLARPVFVGNDSQCFALSEAQGGAADGLRSMFGAILGTGAGGGYCVDGRVVAGYNGVAGEWGHWSIPATLLQRHRLPMVDCPCGLRGCLERYVSGSGLAFVHQHLRGETTEPAAIAARAAAGDPVAQSTLDVHLDLVAHGLAMLVLAYDPHVIVLGGGLSNLPHLYRELPDAMGRHLFAGLHLPVVLPPRFGDAGGARGAALLARQLSS